MQKKPAIIIAVLCVISLGLGYWYGLPKEGLDPALPPPPGPKEPDFLKNGLVAYYPFNGNAKDESGNGYEGTQKGGVTYVQDRFGKSSSACSFDGKDDYIHVDKPLELIDANDITASGWFRINTKGKLLGIQIQGAAWGGQSNSMHTGGYGIGWYAQGNAGPFQSGTPNCPNCWAIKAKEDLGDGWVHVLGTWERDENKVSVTLYVNGRKIQSATSGLLMTGYGQLVQPAGSHIIMGASSWPGHSEGILDNLRIYNRALSEAEVKALYEFESVKP